MKKVVVIIVIIVSTLLAVPVGGAAALFGTFGFLELYDFIKGDGSNLTKEYGLVVVYTVPLGMLAGPIVVGIAAMAVSKYRDKKYLAQYKKDRFT